jgi:molybdopterin-containing oxidoreductase family iron-sulfur binding subunit
MENEKSNETGKANRRKFLKIGLVAGGSIAAGTLAISKILGQDKKTESGIKKTVFTQDGKVYTADQTHLHDYDAPPVSNKEARKGIEGKKFVMVFDLAKCDGCRLCTEACQAMHFTESDREWMKVYKMKDSKSTEPYFFPKPCFQCDNSPCVKVCPVNATFKRQDGIVLVDNERCIGCRSCMAACPYSTRYFNWSKPIESPEVSNIVYSPEQGLPRKIGTVEKCDFCPHMIRAGRLPACVSGCPMDAIYFGDQNEDAVTNSSGVTVKFSKLLEDNAGYRYLEDLGTEPRVFYLPAKNRKYPKPVMDENSPEPEPKKNTNEMKMDHAHM